MITKFLAFERKQRRPRLLRSSPRGAAVIFSIILVTVMLLVAGTNSASQIRANNRQQDLFRSEQAKYAAHAAAEEAIAIASRKLVGYEDSDPTSVEWDTNNNPDMDVTGAYTIYALARGFSSTGSPSSCEGLGCLATTVAGSCISGGVAGCLALPIPGTGDASSSCEFWNIETQPWYGDPDDDCNWNKLAYQDTVTLPLYYYDTNDILVNPTDNNLSKFILRVRTPEGQILQTGEGDATPNDVVLAWEISGACNLDGDPATDETCYLLPKAISGTFSSPSGPGPGPPGPSSSETQIHESDVNNAFNQEVLTITTEGENQDGVSPISISAFFTPSVSPLLHEPVLRLAVISVLIDQAGDRFANLEYQLLVNQPIADNKVVYDASGAALGKLGTYRRHARATKGLDGNSVIIFAVQN